MSRSLRRIAFCFLLCVGAWLAGLVWFISLIPGQPSSDNRHTDAIVVLTGGSGRIEYGLQLLAQGVADKMLITGVHDNTTAEALIHRAPMEIQAVLWNRSITIGHDAENTIGNAEETNRWLKKENVKSLHLVTTNYHMPRSMEEFGNIVRGVEVIPTPFVSDEFLVGNAITDRDTRSRLLTEYHKFIASKIRHYLLSWLRKS